MGKQIIIQVNENNYPEDASETRMCIVNWLIILVKIIEWSKIFLTKSSK